MSRKWDPQVLSGLLALPGLRGWGEFTAGPGRERHWWSGSPPLWAVGLPTARRSAPIPVHISLPPAATLLVLRPITHCFAHPAVMLGYEGASRGSALPWIHETQPSPTPITLRHNLSSVCICPCYLTATLWESSGHLPSGHSQVAIMDKTGACSSIKSCTNASLPG